jgi:hypothetical protein
MSKPATANEFSKIPLIRTRYFQFSPRKTGTPSDSITRRFIIPAKILGAVMDNKAAWFEYYEKQEKARDKLTSAWKDDDERWLNEEESRKLSEQIDQIVGARPTDDHIESMLMLCEYELSKPTADDDDLSFWQEQKQTWESLQAESKNIQTEEFSPTSFLEAFGTFILLVLLILSVMIQQMPGSKMIGITFTTIVVFSGIAVAICSYSRSAKVEEKSVEAKDTPVIKSSHEESIEAIKNRLIR